MAQQVRRHERARVQAAQGLGGGEHTPEEATGRTALRERRHQGCVAKKSGDRTGAQAAGAEHGREEVERAASADGGANERERAAL